RILHGRGDAAGIGRGARAAAVGSAHSSHRNGCGRLMRVAVASWTSRYAGGIESYLGAVMPALRHAGIDVAFFHEADEPSNRARIDLADGVPAFSVLTGGIDHALEQ